ncbi:MAG: hypothetical protein KJ054_06645 [Gammaproteobacteria bacterium]|nr:hypothetical protein [Gammaproteobacteria bacterium]
MAAVVMTSLAGGAGAASISGQGTWETTLQGRDLDGNLATAEAFYDTVLGITWLQDASFAGTAMTLDDAASWTASLDPYGSGITGWRLPVIRFPIDGDESDDFDTSYIGTEDWGDNISAPGTFFAGSTSSEMAHMFYNTLGNKSACDPILSTVSSCVPQAGWGLTNEGPFSNILADGNWTGSLFAPDEDYVDAADHFWVFDLGVGDQYALFVYGATPLEISAWAVHDGDVGTPVSAVPTPAAVWLLGSALGLLGWMRCRNPDV